MKHGTEEFLIENEGVVAGALIPMETLQKHVPQMAGVSQRSTDPVPTSHSTSSSNINTLRLQAEDAIFRKARVSTRSPGAIGVGKNPDDTNLEWTVAVKSAGPYTMTWGYVLGQSKWNMVSQDVALNAGDNTFNLGTTGQSGADFEYLEITSQSVDNPFILPIQAEDGEPEWTTYVSFTGAGAAADVEHTYVEWTPTIEIAGSYMLSWRYALGSGDRPLALSINGTVVIPVLSFPSTDTWSDWGILTQMVRLEAGTNTIRLSALGSSGCNIDYMEITPTEPQRVYCRLFGIGAQPDADALVELGLAMETEDLSNTDVAGDSDIPAGYTYLGQFIDHDITSDPTKLTDSGVVAPTQVKNERSPSLDLDSVYGLGPTDSPDLYEADRVRLKIGMTTPTPRANSELPNDLLRNADKVAIIGDPRNDENLAVAQTHLAFIQFHNATVDKIQTEQPDLSGQALFEAARRDVVLHYQSIVLTDFLPRIAQSDVIDHVLTHGRQFYTDDLRECMPIEFSVAAYRLGHSMVRPVYEWNRVFRTDGTANATMELLFEFSKLSGDFFGEPTLPSDWIIDWTRFYDFADVPGVDNHPDLNFARKIDAKLSFALKFLPEFFSPDIPEIFLSLATRNLLRGRLLQLPTGQAVAQALMNAGVPFTPLTPEEIAAGPHEDIITKHGFDRETPLWYYILKEAKVKNDGNKLGPVGSWLVAEVFIGLVDHSAVSVRTVQPNLTFSMPELLQFVGDLNPIGN